jgi:mannose-6-phosphate isomerase
MNGIGLLKNIVKEYSWGSYTAIPALLGKKPPYHKPQAELWMGAHPSGSSMIKTENGWESLYSLIGRYPDEILGKSCAKKFGDELPFLFKVIAASEPLSIQAHPNRTLAKKGFTRENRQGISHGSSIRNYKDDKHKPELVCALTDFKALCGFRKIPDILNLFKKVCPGSLGKAIDALENNPDSSGLKMFISCLMELGAERKKKVISEADRNVRGFTCDEPAFGCVARLIESHPTDIGVLSPLYLNLVSLSPGQAVFLPSGQLHAYLGGTALELMADSDNVVRGGLTQKHIDPVELLKIVNFRSHRVNMILPVKNRKEYVYKTSAREFTLSKIIIDTCSTYAGPQRRNAEIILCIKGRAVITGAEGNRLKLSRGKSVIVPASEKYYRIDGNATLYKAQTPF